MNIKISALAVLLVSTIVTFTGVASAELTGGSYSLNGGITAISGDSTSSGGNYTVSSRADTTGGASSGGVYSVTGSTPGTTVVTSSSGGGGGIIANQPVLNVESISINPSADGTSATITVNFSNEVLATMLYGEGTINSNTPESAPKTNTHTFTLDGLTPGTDYAYEFTAQLEAEYNSIVSFQFGQYSFSTPEPTEEYVPVYVPVATTTYPLV